MRVRWKGPVLCGVLLLAFSVLPAVAQQPAGAGEADRRLAQDVSGIHQALDRLVTLLETIQDNQRVDLLLKRIELRERRLSPLESRLRTAENEVEGIEGELTQIEATKEQLEDELQEAIRSGEDPAQSEMRRMQGELQRVVAGLNERLQDARRRVQRFEDELAEGREDIAILDEMLLELLESE